MGRSNVLIENQTRTRSSAILEEAEAVDDGSIHAD